MEQSNKYKYSGLKVESGKLKINYSLFDSLEVFGENDIIESNAHQTQNGLFRITLPTFELYRQDT